MAKRILHKFQLDEISGVDRMAQEGAKMVLMKREEENQEQTATVSDKSDDNPSSLDDPTTKSDHYDDNEPLNSKEKAMSKKSEDMTVETLEQDLENIKADLVKAESFGKMNDLEKSHYNNLDTSDKEEFLGMDSESRADTLEKAAANDPVVYTTADGEEFLKSDDPRLVRMAKQSDEDRKLAKADRARAENLELTKRADEELNNLPGDIAMKIDLLKAINEISDEASRKSISELLKAANNSASTAFETHGTTDVAKGDAEEELDNLAKNYAKKESVSFAEAYDAILKTDTGVALYEESQKL